MGKYFGDDCLSGSEIKHKESMANTAMHFAMQKYQHSDCGTTKSIMADAKEIFDFLIGQHKVFDSGA